MATQAVTYMQHDKMLTNSNKKLYGPLADINEEHSFPWRLEF